MTPLTFPSVPSLTNRGKRFIRRKQRGQICLFMKENYAADFQKQFATQSRDEAARAL